MSMGSTEKVLFRVGVICVVRHGVAVYYVKFYCGWVCPGAMCESKVLILWFFSYLALSQALPPALDITALMATEPQCADNLNNLREGFLSGKRWAEASTYLICYIT